MLKSLSLYNILNVIKYPPSLSVCNGLISPQVALYIHTSRLQMKILQNSLCLSVCLSLLSANQPHLMLVRLACCLHCVCVYIYIYMCVCCC